VHVLQVPHPIAEGNVQCHLQQPILRLPPSLTPICILMSAKHIEYLLQAKLASTGHCYTAESLATPLYTAPVSGSGWPSRAKRYALELSLSFTHSLNLEGVLHDVPIYPHTQGTDPVDSALMPTQSSSHSNSSVQFSMLLFHLCLSYTCLNLECAYQSWEGHVLLPHDSSPLYGRRMAVHTACPCP
jgi:hypothetical protein